MKKSYLAALERREATLLNLVDRQVDKKQEILAEMRLEVAAARAKVLAAREEGNFKGEGYHNTVYRGKFLWVKIFMFLPNELTFVYYLF